MSDIRRQSIISSAVVYLGFALGFVNTYLFTRQGGFTKEQFGLTSTFLAFANIMFSVASLGMPAYIGKFFPYYKAHLPKKKNDQLTWALLITLGGFLLVTIAGIAFKKILIDKIFSNSPELPKYYYWTFPFGLGFTIYMLFEAYAWQHRKAVLTNFLKEVLFRIFVTALIIMTTFGLIKNFDQFIKFYSFTYLFLALFLILFFYAKKELPFTVQVSHVSRRFYKKIKTLVSFVWGGGLVFNIANVFDTIIIAAVLPDGMAAAGIFALAQNISSLMQAPQRAIISASVGSLSQAWKDKDYAKINRVYHRSSINQLIFSAAMFALIWLNFEDGVHTFHLQEAYLGAKWIFFFIACSKLIDMGTGLNAQIIGTSTYWRFEFISGIILLTVFLFTNYELTRYLGLYGPAISTLVSFTLYNTIRCIFLWKKFRMQPFSWKSLQTILLAGAAYLIAYSLFKNEQGLLWIFLRSLVFMLIFMAGMFIFNLSPDVWPVLRTLQKRLRLGHR